MTHPTVTTTRTDLFAGRYRVEGALGHGGGADVLRAVDERLQRTVALKVLRPGSAADADRFVTEALSLARLRHPGLVEVYDADATGAHPYLVLELVDGPTLAALLSAGPLGPAATARTGRQLARTLAFVHRHRIVHRDVKPSNVLIDRDGNPRLADFGIARALDDAGHTRTGAIVGTPAYLAPEQVRGQGAGPAADVYALGLLLIECLTGRREYTGGPVEAAVARLLRPPAVPSGLPPHLARALAAMTAADPLRRPAASSCVGLLASADGARVPAVPARRRYLPLAAAALALTGLAGSVGLAAPRVPPAPARQAPASPAPATAPAADTPTAAPSPDGVPSRNARTVPAARPPAAVPAAVSRGNGKAPKAAPGKARGARRAPAPDAGGDRQHRR